ncbi:hypothetical protein HDU87_001338 [Geranomyces variabilis]|uniref:G-protein coupled receptors family 3 profile domain-containing protein n=1 Tax=Geranomyces variabilis TaxID=109894 RepID=A0AAD5TML7_9FUNG|nr:hypothetical protein HDU87_001338 [Geranomyces variabilis]
MYSDQAIYTALVTGGFSIPNAFAEVGASNFEDRNQYPNTLRMVIGTGTLALRMMQYINAMGWSKLAYIYSAQDLGSSYVPSVIATGRTFGMEFLTQQTFNANGDLAESDLDSVIDSIKSSNARIIVVTADEFETTALWLRAHAAGIVTADYVWVTVNGIIDFAIGDFYSQYAGQSVNDTLGSAIANNNGVQLQMFIGASEDTPEYLQFISYYQSMLTTAELATVIPNDDGSPPDPETAIFPIRDGYPTEDRLWDCAMAIFYGFDQLLKSNSSLTATMLVNADYTPPKDPSVPYNMAPFTNISIFNTNQQGLAGPYEWENGDFLNIITEIEVQVNGEVNELSTDFPVIAKFVNETVVLVPSNFFFYGGSMKVPADLPPAERFNPEWKSLQGVLFSLIAALFLIVHFVWAGLVYIFRAKTIIKRASWFSLVLIALGLIMVDIAPLLYVGRLKNWTCVAQVFVLNMGFGLVFSNLMAKTWRVYRIFNNPKMVNRKISDAQVLSFTAGIAAIEIILSIVWMAVGQPVPTTLYLSEIQLVVVCQSSNSRVQETMQAICYGFNGVLLVLTTVLSYKTRKVLSDYNETKWIGLSVYNILAVSVLFIPLVYTTALASHAFMFRSIAILLGTGVTGASMFGPKIMILLRSEQKHLGAQEFAYTKALMAKMDGAGSNAFVAKYESATTSDSHNTPRKIQALQLANVPVLLSGRGISSWLARWRVANLRSMPGCICIELLDDGTSAAKIMAFRTDTAICRNVTTTSDDAGAAADLVTPDTGEKGTVPSVSRSPDGQTTLIIVTLDGTLELVVTAAAAVELCKHVSGSATGTTDFGFSDQPFNSEIAKLTAEEKETMPQYDSQ